MFRHSSFALRHSDHQSHSCFIQPKNRQCANVRILARIWNTRTGTKSSGTPGVRLVSRGAFDRCFGTVVKNQRHPVAGGNLNRSARLFRSLELLRATNNSVQRVEQRALLINHQLGVTDDCRWTTTCPISNLTSEELPCQTEVDYFHQQLCIVGDLGRFTLTRDEHQVRWLQIAVD